MEQSCRLLAVVALISGLVASAFAAETKGGSQTKTGTVTKVDPNTGTIEVMMARALTFSVTPDTQILQGGAPATLANVKVGATVTVVYSRLSEQNRVASRVTIAASAPVADATGTDVQVHFTLETKDPQGVPIRQERSYWVYRPRDLARSGRVPMVLIMDRWSPTLLQRKADRAGFLVVACAPVRMWLNDDPRICGYQDYDYLTEVIRRVGATENGGDAFVVGLSKGGHTALAYACERPDMIRAAASVDEFMGLTSNRPTAPLPIIVFQGTADTNVPYTMVKDTVDAWRAVDGLMNAVPVTAYKAAPRAPGSVSQATWSGGIGGTQVALVTIVSGGHVYPHPDIQTGYDYTDDLWAFFSQFLTAPPSRPEVVSQPVDNVQRAGQPASFRVVAACAGTLTYQWQRDGTDLPGATESWLTLPTVTPADDSATFRAVATAATGTVTSASATLTVLAPPPGPAITTQPASLTVAAGQPASFSVTAEGVPPLRYQWRRNGVDLPGATGASCSLPVTVPFDSGATFSAAVSDGSGTTTSTPATLTVTRPPGAPIILTNPARARVLVGQPGSFSVAAWSPTPVRYQWQRGEFTGHMTDIPGATGATYTTPPADLAEHHALFRCLVSNAAGSVASASEMLFVTAEPKAPTEITSPISVTAQAGVPFRYDLTSSGGTIPLTYSADPVPSGLVFDPVSGQISGTPTQAGSTRLAVGAANRAGRVSAVLVLTVTATPPLIDIEAWRAAHFGAGARDIELAGDASDPDGDGTSNVEEFNRKTDPLDRPQGLR